MKNARLSEGTGPFLWTPCDFEKLLMDPTVSSLVKAYSRSVYLRYFGGVVTVLGSDGPLMVRVETAANNWAMSRVGRVCF